MNLLVRGKVKAYEEGGCTLAFLQDVKLTGLWLRNTTIFVRAGSLGSSSPFAVSVNAGPSRGSPTPRERTSCWLQGSLCVARLQTVNLSGAQTRKSSSRWITRKWVETTYRRSHAGTQSRPAWRRQGDRGRMVLGMQAIVQQIAQPCCSATPPSVNPATEGKSMLRFAVRARSEVDGVPPRQH